MTTVCACALLNIYMSCTVHNCHLSIALNTFVVFDSCFVNMNPEGRTKATTKKKVTYNPRVMSIIKKIGSS